jgi:hypothetical protein
MLTFEISIEETVMFLESFKGKVFKLLPLREEGKEWEKHLESLLIQLHGSQILFTGKLEFMELIVLLNGMHKADFPVYRRSVFECINLLDRMKETYLENFGQGED